jgi:hypothetical protein
LTTIDPSSQLALALQAQLAALKDRGKASAGSAGNSHAAPHNRVTSTLAQRLLSIAPDDPDRRRKAVRMFLQSELVREFGEAVLNDPQFGTMLDAVQEQMAQDDRTAAAVHALGDLLLAGKVVS